MSLKNIFFMVLTSTYAVSSFAAVTKPSTAPTQIAPLTAPTSDVTTVSLQVTSAWARASTNTMQSGKNNNSAAYFTIINNSSEERQITDVTSDVAKTVELHNSFVNESGVSKMVKVDKLVIPAQGNIELKPGGIHIMLIKLRRNLKPGDKFIMTLHFDDKTQQVVEVDVRNNAN